jgi:hypothetical protein
MWVQSSVEHEATHLVAPLYMLAQRTGSGALSPAGFITPSWTSAVEDWNTSHVPQSKTAALGSSVVSLAHDYVEADDDDTRSFVESHEFGWDNEHSKRQVDIRRFKTDSEWQAAATNTKFYQIYIGNRSGQVSFPASRVDDCGMIKVCAFFPSNEVCMFDDLHFRYALYMDLWR